MCHGERARAYGKRVREHEKLTYTLRTRVLFEVRTLCCFFSLVFGYACRFHQLTLVSECFLLNEIVCRRCVVLYQPTEQKISFHYILVYLFRNTLSKLRENLLIQKKDGNNNNRGET